MSGPLTARETKALSALLRTRPLSSRSYQRTVALWIATRQEHAPTRIPREVLRAVCRSLRIYDCATFMYYMGDFRSTVRARRPWFIERGDDKGWDLTPEGEADALEIFGPVKA